MNQSTINPLSIVINVKNGQTHLTKCLNSLSRFNEVILLDNYSTDNTIEIAKKYANVQIYSSEFLGMGKVRNLAMSYSSSDWVFFVDCDEVLSVDLVDYLLNYEFVRGNIYKIRRVNYYNTYKLESSSWENDWILRLFNRKDTKFIENEVHDSFDNMNLAKTNIMVGNIYHFPYQSVSGLIDKMQFYSSLYAKQFFNKKKPKLYPILWRAFFMFIKCYVLKRGFMDGYEGFVVSCYNSMGVFSKYIKLYELYYKKYLILLIDLTDVDNLDSLINAINAQMRLPNKVIFVVNEVDSQLVYKMILGKLVMEYEVKLRNNFVTANNFSEYIGELEVEPSYMVILKDFKEINDRKMLQKIHKNIMYNKHLDNSLYQVIEMSTAKHS